MQDLARLPESSLILGRKVFCPGTTPPPPGLDLLMEELESVGLRPAEYPLPPPQNWNGVIRKFVFEADSIPPPPSRT